MMLGRADYPYGRKMKLDSYFTPHKNQFHMDQGHNYERQHFKAFRRKYQTVSL